MAQQVKKNMDPGALTQVARTFQLVWRLPPAPAVPVFPMLFFPLVFVLGVSRVEVSPVVILVLGQMDAWAFFFLESRFFIDLCPADIVMEHRRAIAGDTGTTRDE